MWPQCGPIKKYCKSWKKSLKLKWLTLCTSMATLEREQSTRRHFHFSLWASLMADLANPFGQARVYWKEKCMPKIPFKYFPHFLLAPYILHIFGLLCEILYSLFLLIKHNVFGVNYFLDESGTKDCNFKWLAAREKLWMAPPLPVYRWLYLHFTYGLHLYKSHATLFFFNRNTYC